MSAYFAMPIGRATVLLVHEGTDLLCVVTLKNRKIKLNPRWWKRAEQYLANALQPAIEVK